MEPSTTAVSPTEPAFDSLLGEFRADLESRLEAHLATKLREARDEAPEAAVMVQTLSRTMTAGGKRLRPALAWFGYRACGGGDDRAAPLALATEFLHAYLLVHDDIMDRAEVRRGEPAPHVVFREIHRQRGWRDDPEHYGQSIGILVGDLAASYAYELFAGLEPRPASWRRLERCFATMCQEVIHGQYLEILASFVEAPSEDDLLRVLRLKSGRYSVERPLELGALLADADPDTVAALKRYGSAAGEAFQLQDDVLGMLGDASRTGKPVGGDLIEGKYTFLIHHAMAEAGTADREFLAGARGRADLSPDEVERAVTILHDSGAVEAVQAMIRTRLAAARDELASVDLTAEGRAFLSGLLGLLEGRDV